MTDTLDPWHVTPWYIIPSGQKLRYHVKIQNHKPKPFQNKNGNRSYKRISKHETKTQTRNSQYRSSLVSSTNPQQDTPQGSGLCEAFNSHLTGMDLDDRQGSIARSAMQKKNSRIHHKDPDHSLLHTHTHNQRGLAVTCLTSLVAVVVLLSQHATSNIGQKH